MSLRDPGRTGGLTHRTLTGMLWMAWGRVAHAVLQLLVLAVLARLVSPHEFGLVSAALVVVGLCTILSHVGLGPALVQRRDLEQAHIDTAFTASVLLGVGVGAAVWGLAPVAAAFFQIDGLVPVLRALALAFPLQGLGLVSESLVRRDLNFKWIANRDVVSYVVGYGAVGIGVAWAGYGVWALVLAHVAQVALRTGLLVVHHPPRLQRPGTVAAFRDLCYFGGGFTLAKVANYVALQADNVVVGRMLGPAALGFYGRAYQLMTAPAHGIGLVLDNVLFPAMARVQDDPVRLARTFRRGVALIALLVLPLSLVLLLVAPELVRLLLGARWANVIAPFEVLAAGMLFRTSYKMSDSLARSTGAVYRRAWRQAQYAALVIAGAAIGQRWGITGVAWGVLLAVSINFFSMAQLSLSVVGMTWREFARAHVPAALLTALVMPPVWLVAIAARHWAAPDVAVLTLVSGTALLLALAAVWRFPTLFLGADGVWMLNALRGLLPPRLAPLVPVPSRASGA